MVGVEWSGESTTLRPFGNLKYSTGTLKLSVGLAAEAANAAVAVKTQHTRTRKENFMRLPRKNEIDCLRLSKLLEKDSILQEKDVSDRVL